MGSMRKAWPLTSWFRRPSSIAWLVLFAAAAPTRSASIWEVGKPQGGVDTLEHLPGPQSFYEKYLRVDEGAGKPVLFKGAAKSMPAFNLWTDEYLREHYGSVEMDQVETEKRETRTAFPHEDWNLAKFLDRYQTSEIYSTATTPAGLANELYMLPAMNCGGGYHKRLASTVLWFSSGSTKSVIHNDGQHNFHCMFAGRKEWIMWHPKSPISSPELGWVYGEREAEKDPSFKNAYGAYVGKIDVDNVDLKKFPAWDNLDWWNMTLDAGDCAYIPPKWYHFVESPPQRSISVHVWFHSAKAFDKKSCDKLEAKGYNVSDFLFRMGDCSFGYEQENPKATSCKLRKAFKEERKQQEQEL